ncbi:hypothetical protein PIROE2DRAFT_3440 [Piromyces sp. E2]|nr:hypothetical protein PIROE2DRAFT_3440 [Piromyces sp. E2]|eukprot:OUM68754.1 hypothetical protein PIROE2DRAFT_3440 [Piromyces sp. E2]
MDLNRDYTPFQLKVVSGIGISFVDENIYKCKNLEEIDLSGNQISEFPFMLINLKNLRYIDLHNNLIDDNLPEAISDLENLDYIDLSGNINIRGKTLTNDNLQSCYYENTYSLCKAKDMDCFNDVTFENCPNDEKTINNDCEALVTYLNRKGITDALSECSVNEKGELDYIDRLLIEEDIDKIFSYETVTKLVLIWQNTKYTIDKIANLKNLEELEIYNSKGGTLDLTSMQFDKLNIL